MGDWSDSWASRDAGTIFIRRGLASQGPCAPPVQEVCGGCWLFSLLLQGLRSSWPSSGLEEGFPTTSHCSTSEPETQGLKYIRALDWLSSCLLPTQTRNLCLSAHPAPTPTRKADLPDSPFAEFPESVQLDHGALYLPVVPKNDAFLTSIFLQNLSKCPLSSLLES